MNGQGILSVKIEYYRKLIVYKLVKASRTMLMVADCDNEYSVYNDISVSV